MLSAWARVTTGQMTQAPVEPEWSKYGTRRISSGQGSVMFLNREVRRRFSGAIAIDATFAEVTGKQKSRPNIKPGDMVSTNADCGWYSRHGDHDGEADGADKAGFGWELEYAIATRRPDEVGTDYPLLFLATSGHLPGQIRGHALALYQSIVDRGHTVDHVVTDRAYLPGSDAEFLQRPLAIAKVKVVMDYKNVEEEIGIQATFTSGKHHLIMVAGSWHFGFMPENLIHAEKTYRDLLASLKKLMKHNKITPEERDRLKDEGHKLLRTQRSERTRYRLIPRSNFFADASRQYAYPDFTDPIVMDPDTGKFVPFVSPGKTVKVPGNLSTKKGELNQKHLKYGQEYDYKSELWRAWFGRRNQVENGNSCLKDADRAALAIPMKRRMKGPWAVEMAGALAAATTNIERILDWLKVRLALGTMNRKNRTSAALFEPGLATLTVEEHDDRNPFKELAEIHQLRLIA